MEDWDNREEIFKLRKKIERVEAINKALEDVLESVDTQIKELINMENVTSEVVDKILQYLEASDDTDKKQGRNIPKNRKTKQ